MVTFVDISPAKLTGLFPLCGLKLATILLLRLAGGADSIFVAGRGTNAHMDDACEIWSDAADEGGIRVAEEAAPLLPPNIPHFLCYLYRNLFALCKVLQLAVLWPEMDITYEFLFPSLIILGLRISFISCCPGTWVEYYSCNNVFDVTLDLLITCCDKGSRRVPDHWGVIIIQEVNRHFLGSFLGLRSDPVSSVLFRIGSSQTGY